MTSGIALVSRFNFSESLRVEHLHEILRIRIMELTYIKILLILSATTSIASHKTHRLPCRRSGLFKKIADAGKIQDGIINRTKVESLPHCVRDCLRNTECESINIKKKKYGRGKQLCELLNVTVHSSVLLHNVNWKHYEPLWSVSITNHQF